MNLDWLKAIAPTVASALGGPLAGLAVTAVGAAFGWSDATKDKVLDTLQTGNLTADQITALKVAEIEMVKNEREFGFKFAELEIRDRESARSMQIATKSSTPEVLSWVVIVSTVVLEGYVLLVGLPPEAPELVVGRILGTLDMAFATVLAFWLGTSKSSQTKDATIAAQAASK